LAERIVNGHLKDLTSDQRADCFVFDDSLYSRTGYKKTELAAKDGAQIDARIVCVRNRSNRKDWIDLICTDMTIDENEIIRIYGKRWDIEVFFKTCKSFLKLGTEYHGLSYDALTAHTAFVFLRYMFMSVEKRDDEDDRTIGELFYCMVDELADITFNHSLQILVEAMFESAKEIFQPTEEQMERFTKAFISRLPKYMQVALTPSLTA
ncbi:transposase, partial [Lactobacillus delbrueckii subsp. lactis]